MNSKPGKSAKAILAILFAGLFFTLAFSGCVGELIGTMGAPQENEAEIGPAVKGPGWFKGDLHCHTTNSDGDIDVASLIALAENKGFDYFVITDHNTSVTWENPAYLSSKMTLLYGVEWTTEQGHANVWSSKPFDWSAIEPTLANNDAKGVIEATHAQSVPGQEVLFSINHPYAPGGCEWTYSFEDSSEADCMEVWNSGFMWPNMNFMSTWSTLDSYLKEGKKISMVGGSDAHAHGIEPTELTNWAQTFYGDIGIPTTWVYANSSSGEDIIQGIKAGHVFMSRSTTGPQVQLFADADGKQGEQEIFETIMGDSLPESAIGNPVNFRVRVFDAKLAEVVDAASFAVVIKNGQPLTGMMASSEDYTFDFTDTPAEGDYYRVELRQLNLRDTSNFFGELTQIGWVAALTNPIYAW